MTTQDTGLVEECMRADMVSELLENAARAAYEDYFSGLIGCAELPWLELPQSHRDRLMQAHSVALLAILPHLSPESQALLRKELNGE